MTEKSLTYGEVTKKRRVRMEHAAKINIKICCLALAEKPENNYKDKNCGDKASTQLPSRRTGNCASKQISHSTLLDISFHVNEIRSLIILTA